MATTIKPDGMQAREWFDRTTQLFARVIPTFILSSETAWRDWAANARRAQPQVPDPYQFPQWNLWADRFNQVMSLVRI